MFEQRRRWPKVEREKDETIYFRERNLSMQKEKTVSELYCRERNDVMDAVVECIDKRV